MARPAKKETVEETTEVKEVKTTTKAKPTADNSNTEVEELKKQNEMLMRQMAEIQKQIANGELQSTTAERKLTNDTDITVVSLTQGTLNLCTEGMGQGIIYTFNNLYDEIDIPFEDVKNIVRVNRTMAENGRFFVQNEEAVKKLRLNHHYENLLSPEDLKGLLDSSPNTVVEYYKIANDAQKELIKDLLINANFNNSVDRNILYAFTELTGVDFSNFIDTTKK